MIYSTPAALDLKARTSLIPGSFHLDVNWLKCVEDFQTYTKSYEIAPLFVSSPPPDPE